MTAGLPLPEVKTAAASKALKSAEWMAENAYIAPGFHRLLTAGSLTLGLYGGRKVMDVITARNASNGEEIPASQTVELMRPLHGVMRYNPYSDSAADRWKFVVDKMAPVATGAVAAYFGGKYFFNGHMPNKEAFFPTGDVVRKAVAAGKYSTEATDAMMRLFNADAIRKWAAATFIEGSSTGQHIFGALWPFNNGMIAVSFQDGAQRNIFVPGLKKLNKLLGNNGGSSRGQFSAMRDTATFMTTNIMRELKKDGAGIEAWATEKALLPRAQDGLQKYPTQSAKVPELVKKYQELVKTAKDSVPEFARTYQEKHNVKAVPEGVLREHIQKVISGQKPEISKHGLFGAAHDHMLHDAGVDLRHTDLAQGPFQELGRRFGSRKKQASILEGHAEYLKTEFKDHERNYNHLDVKTWADKQLHTPPWKVAAVYGGAGAAVVGGLGAAAAVGAKLHSRSQQAHKPHILDQSSIGQHIKPATAEKPKGDANLIDWINDKPLGVAHWMSRVVIAPPSMHRFMNAAYLSAVLYVGMKGSNLLTGRVLTKLNSSKFVEVEKLLENGNKVKELVSESVYAKENVWKPLRPLHGLMSYTPGSAEIGDRWKQAAHYIMPVTLGAFGTWTGSHMYFADRIKSLSKPENLEDYTDRISMEQSKPYGALTAVTSIFNTGSGMHLLPVFNYSANLHNRYLLGSGQQVAMPGIGKWWSGNPGTTPWGVKHTLVQLTNYLTYNDDARPKELRSLVHSVIAKLYPDLSDDELLDKKQVMIDRIHDVRDSYLVEGVVPPSKRAALGDAMHKLFSGAGFEALLLESGLDPAKANLASNGASGSIANFLGSKHSVNKLTEEYRAKFAERHAATTSAEPSDFLKNLLDKGPLQPTKLAETPETKSFTERTKPESSAYPVMSV